MRRLIAIACVVTFPPLASAQVDPPPPSDGRIPVYVRTAGAGGFSDPDKGRRDSTRDLIKRLQKSSRVRLAAEGESVVTLHVLSRSTKLDRADPMTALFGGRGQKHSSLVVQLTAGDYTTDFSATAGASGVFSNYSEAASKITKDFENWIIGNEERLRTLMAEKFAVASPAPPQQQ